MDDDDDDDDINNGEIGAVYVHARATIVTLIGG
jgi:hypothetical protein